MASFGEATWNALFPYMYGYTSYVIRPSDTLYSIANKFSSSVNRILVANPNINPNNLQVGASITLPFGSTVQTNISYTYDILKMNISSFSVIYPFLKIQYIGTSIMGKQIPCIRIGTGEKEVFYSSSIHANEWITSPLVMKFIEDLALAYVNDDYIYGYLARNILASTSIYIVPMCNPDGVDLVTNNISKNSSYYKNAEKIASRYPSIPFPSGWKANIEGVDLNLQFPARLGKC